MRMDDEVATTQITLEDVMRILVADASPKRLQKKQPNAMYVQPDIALVGLVQ